MSNRNLSRAEREKIRQEEDRKWEQRQLEKVVENLDKVPEETSQMILDLAQRYVGS